MRFDRRFRAPGPLRLRRPCRLAGVLAAGLLVPIAAAADTARAADPLPAPTPAPAPVTRLEGQAFDRTGASLPGLAVRLTLRVETQVSPFKPVEVAERVLGTAVTDGQGFFALEVKETDPNGRILLRCGDPRGWDAIRYAAPAERDVTARVRPGRASVANCVIEDAPGWNALAREINRAGGLSSPQGKVLRARGLPTATETLADGVVEWRYTDARYRFRGGVLVEGPPPAGPRP